jgi:hypothetical protein
MFILFLYHGLLHSWTETCFRIDRPLKFTYKDLIICQSISPKRLLLLLDGRILGGHWLLGTYVNLSNPHTAYHFILGQYGSMRIAYEEQTANSVP